MIAVAVSAVAFLVFTLVAFAELGPGGARGPYDRGVLGVPVLFAVVVSSLIIGEVIGGWVFWAAILAGVLVGAVAAYLAGRRFSGRPPPRGPKRWVGVCTYYDD